MSSRHRMVAAGALLASHCAGMLDLVALPIWIGALVQYYGFTPSAAGAGVTVFLACAVVASAGVAPRFDRFRPHRLAILGFVLAAAAFGTASLCTELPALVVLHALAGLGVGTGLSATHGTIGRSDQPHRLFAMAGVALGLFGTILLAILPAAVEARGGPVLFVAFAGIMAFAAVVDVLAFPRRVGREQPKEAAPAGGFTAPVRLVIAGICFMTLNNAMVFSFVDVIGKARDFPPSDIMGTFVALGLLNFAVVAPLGVLLERRLRAETVIVLGPIAQATLAIAIATAGDFRIWACAVALYTGVLIFTHTFAFGLLARLDPTGRAVAATPAMLMTGAALGPLLGGLAGQRFGFEALGAVAGLFAALALACFTRKVRLAAGQPRPAAS